MGGGKDNQISVSSKKVIQSIKEIVNFPEDEIYSILKDCNMDPSEAVTRLLNQDSFHEVKSKREKKKEGKDMTDSRSRSNTSSSTRGSKGGTDRYSSRNNNTQFNSSDYATQRGKPVYQKEIEPQFSVAGNHSNSWQTVLSDTPIDKPLSTNATASILPTLQPSGFLSAWSGGMPGQVSMADIVRLGRPRGNTSNNVNVSQQYTNGQHASNVSEVNQNDEWGRDYASNVPEVNQNDEWGRDYASNVPEVNQNDEWGRDEEPPDASGSSIVEPHVESEPYIDQYDITQQQFRSQERYEEEYTVDDEHGTYVEPVSGSNQNLQENNYVSASGFDNELYQNIDSYQPDHLEAEDPNVSVSSMTNNFVSLSFPKDDKNTPNENEDAESEDGSPAVKIPEHLQVQTAHLSHLSFGSFGCGAFAPRPAHTNEEEPTIDTDAPSAGQLEARNNDYYEEERRATSSDGNNAPHSMGADSGNFEAPTVSQTEIFQQEALESAHPNQYSFPSSTADYAYENSQQINSSQVSSQMMQGLPSLTGAMSYSDSLPGTMMLVSNMQPSLEAEMAYAQFSQSMAAKYGVSSLSDPTASMAELLKASNLSGQLTQTLPGSNISGAAGLPQYFLPQQQALNMMGYPPFLPQGYSYMPSNFQQPFATGNGAYPQSGGYGGGFGNSNTGVPNDFLPSNPPSAHPATNMNYDDVFAAQFRDAGLHFPPEKAAALRNLMHFNSRNFERQQPPAGFQQRPSVEQYAPPGYHDYYQQQQMLRDGTSQVPPQLKQTQHLWQNNY